MKVCVYILSSVKGVAYTILLQTQIKKVVHSGKFEVWEPYLSFFLIVTLILRLSLEKRFKAVGGIEEVYIVDWRIEEEEKRLEEGWKRPWRWTW